MKDMFCLSLSMLSKPIVADLAVQTSVLQGKFPQSTSWRKFAAWLRDCWDQESFSAVQVSSYHSPSGQTTSTPQTLHKRDPGPYLRLCFLEVWARWTSPSESCRPEAWGFNYDSGGPRRIHWCTPLWWWCTVGTICCEQQGPVLSRLTAGTSHLLAKIQQPWLRTIGSKYILSRRYVLHRGHHD